MMATRLSHLDGTPCTGLDCQACMLAVMMTGNNYVVVTRDGALAGHDH